MPDLPRPLQRRALVLGMPAALVSLHGCAMNSSPPPRHRERGVVVLGASAQVFPPGMAEALAVASDPTRPDPQRLAALRLCMFAPGNDPTPWLQGWHPGLRAAYRAAGQSPAKSVWFGRSHSPILDLQGAQGAWRPASTRNELKALLGDKVTVQVIAQAGHALVPEQPMRWPRPSPTGRRPCRSRAPPIRDLSDGEGQADPVQHPTGCFSCSVGTLLPEVQTQKGPRRLHAAGLPDRVLRVTSAGSPRPSLGHCRCHPPRHRVP